MRNARIQHKIANRGMGYCISCGQDHGTETRLESARRRRVEGIERKLRRRQQKSLPRMGEIKFVFAIDTSQFAKVMTEMSARMMKFGDAIKKTPIDPYIQAARFAVLDAQMERQGYAPVETLTFKKTPIGHYEPQDG